MSAANKRKGSLFETDVLKYLRLQGFDAERLRLTGRDDEGDLVVKVGGLTHVLECKATKVNNLTDFIRQAKTEAGNYDKHRGLLPGTSDYAVVVKKRQASIKDAFVVVSLEQYLELIRFDTTTSEGA